MPYCQTYKQSKQMNKKDKYNKRLEDITFEELDELARPYFEKELEEANKALDIFYKWKKKMLEERNPYDTSEENNDQE